MKYALNLNEENRILSVTYNEYAPANQPRVEELPQGDVSDYKYVDGAYVYEPLPKSEEVTPEPTTNEILDVLLGTGGVSNEQVTSC